LCRTSYTLGFVGHEQDALGVQLLSQRLAFLAAWHCADDDGSRVWVVGYPVDTPVEFVTGFGVEDSVLAGDVVVVHDLVVGG
jgi:hypothetical protein